jgi:exosortase
MSHPGAESSVALLQSREDPRVLGGGIQLRAVPALLIGVILVLAMGWAFSEFLLSNIRWAVRHPADWGHLLVIPLIAGWFIWQDRERLAAIRFRTTWVGLLPLGLGLAWYAMCVAGSPALWHHNLRGLGFGVALFGLALLFCGWSAMRVLWFPLLYVVIFGQHISAQFLGRLTERLQDFAAKGSWLVLNTIGIDTDRSGNLLTVWHDGVAKTLNIAEACSGMRMLVAFLALGVAMAYTGLPRLWQRVLLVAMAIPVALLVNVLRVVTLGILSLWDADFAAGEFHTMIGLLWLVPAFLLYLGILWILRRVVIEEKEVPATPA